MKQNEWELNLQNILTYGSVVFIENNVITMTFDLGDEEDAERFEKKYQKLVESEDKISSTISILLDESEDECPWSIANIEIELNKDISVEELNTFISKIESI